MQNETPHRQMCPQQPTAQPVDRGALREAIAQEETLLATLEAEQAESKHRLAALRAELAALDTAPEIRVHLPLPIETPIPRSSADKVRLFRSLFRGRKDIFPTRFMSKKTGKSGYCVFHAMVNSISTGW